MEQCHGVLPRHPCPLCCHLPWFMVVEKCHQFNQYLWCHTIDAKRRKSQQSQVWQRREKRNLDTLYGGQVNIYRLSAQTTYVHTKLSCCALLLALQLWYSCNCNLNLEIITDSGSFLRLLAISIIFVNYVVEDLVVEWMWLDAVYEFCGGEVTSDMRMKMRTEISHKHKTDMPLLFRLFVRFWGFTLKNRI